MRGAAPYQVADARWRSRAGWEEGSGGARAEEIEGRRRALLGGGGGFSATCDSFPSFLFFPCFPSLESVLCAAACEHGRTYGYVKVFSGIFNIFLKIFSSF